MRAACSANSSCTQRASTGAAPETPQSVRIESRSASPKRGRSERRRSGAATIPSSSARKCPAIRSMVAPSHRSVRYSRAPEIPSPPSLSVRIRSKAITPVRVASGSTRAPPRRSGPSAPADSSANVTWKTGEWPGLRSTPTSSTRRSKGRSWWSSAASIPARVRRSAPRTVGASARRARRARTFTKKPISGSCSTRLRPATGVPTTTSSCPDQRASSACHPARRVMNGVASSRRPSSRSAPVSAGGSSSGTDAPRASATAGRGRSVGSSSSGGAPASASRHHSICRSRTSPRSRSRCHAAKSAYCVGSSGSGEGSPAEKAAYSSDTSRTSTPMLHPSLTTWCSVKSTAKSRSSRRSAAARKSGPVDRSNGRPASAAARRRSSRARASSASPARSTTGRPTASEGATTCTGSGSASSKRVRSAAWRRTTSASERRSTAGSSGPRTRSARGML